MVGGGDSARGGLMGPQPLVPQAGWKAQQPGQTLPFPRLPPPPPTIPPLLGGEWVGLMCYWGASAHRGSPALSTLPQVNNNKDGGDSHMRRVINTS